MKKLILEKLAEIEERENIKYYIAWNPEVVLGAFSVA